MGIQVCSNEGSRPFPRGGNYKKRKDTLAKFKNFFSRTTGPISIKLGKKHPRVKRIQICSNEWPCLFQRGDHYKTAKIHWRNIKNFFCWTNFNQTWHKAFLGEGDSSFCKKGPFNYKIGDDWFLFSKSTLRYNYSFEQICLLILTGFTGERCGPYASCYSEDT